MNAAPVAAKMNCSQPWHAGFVETLHKGVPEKVLELICNE